MSQHYDAIVVGVGGMGSAATYHLARRGARVLALEQFDICHEFGSSHGFSRIIRLAYWEDPRYVPLVREAYGLWQQLEQDTGRRLLTVTGGLDLGAPGTSVFDGALASARAHGLAHEVLDGKELRRRYPMFNFRPEIGAVFQPQGGYLIPEACIAAHVEEAQRLGADVRCREPVLEWEARADAVTVKTPLGSYSAGKLVLCSGPWMSQCLPGLPIPLQVERQVVGWFQPRHPDWFQPERFPVWNLEDGGSRYYGLPIHAVPGVKLARYHHRDETVDPNAADRTPNAADRELLRRLVSAYFPDADGAVVGLRVCLFTNTPDEHFILDRHPAHRNVAVISPCSGHGFKFCSVVGKIAAELAIDGRSSHPIDWLGLSRFRP